MHVLRVRYQTIEFGETDLHVRTLRNRQEFSDPDNIAKDLGISSANWSLFGIVWASGEILARLMFDYDIEGKRILEVGCGIGLASLVLNQRSADITATDYHPDVESFLIENTKLNHSNIIPFIRTSWTDEITNLGKFDIIIGSDLLYERSHADELSNFINQHANSHCTVIIVDPSRPYRTRFSKNMIELGFLHSKHKFEDAENLTQPTRGCSQFYTLYYQR